ncbi:MAG: DUF3105 domain-containing protein [Acidimicrobiia bacterium]|nr:DUF3105 domain-containing protein [Acidimicrobiia bacterium]
MRRIAIVAVALAVAACSGGSEPVELGVGVERFDDFGNQHFADSDLQDILAGASTFAYETFPATSGPHAASWAPCGIYVEEVPEVFVVHSMEHGAVIIHHDPGLPGTDVDAIHSTARSLGSHVVVTPRAGLAEPVAVTAWTVMARLGSVDTGAIEDFWDEFSQQGPERLPCPIEIDQAG